MPIDTPNDTLFLTVGSANVISIALFDSNGDEEDLTGCSDPVILIQTTTGDDAVGVLTIEDASIVGNKLVHTLTQIQADALDVGIYYGFVTLTKDGVELKLRTPFRVEISE